MRRMELQWLSSFLGYSSSNDNKNNNINNNNTIVTGTIDIHTHVQRVRTCLPEVG